MSAEIFAPPGMEELTNQIQGMFQNMGGGRRKSRKLKIREAMKLLVDEEAAKLVNDEEVKLDAVTNVEQNGIVFLDEIDAALPSVLFVLQSVLEEDKRELHIPETGETIRASEHFRIFGTGNTIGFRAQHRAKHAGTNPMNQAFVDRFGMVIAVSYPSKDEETKRISVHVPSLDPVYLEGIARTGALLRADEKFKADLSTRRLIQWAKLVEAFDGNVLRAADLAFLRKLDTPADAKVARETIGRIFGYSEKEMSEEGV